MTDKKKSVDESLQWSRVQQFLAAFERFNGWLCEKSRTLAGAFLAVMTGVVILQVFFRYVLNDSLSWTEELSKTMMVWSALLVAPWAYRSNANVALTMFMNELPSVLRNLTHLVIDGLVFWIAAIFVREGIDFCVRGQSIRAASMPIQVAWFYSVIPIAFSLVFLVSFERLLIRITSIFCPSLSINTNRLHDVLEL